VRGAAVVVGTLPVTVVPRVVAVRDVGAGVAVAAVDAVVVDTAGWSGAAAFWTCVAAKALIDASDVSVVAVAIARRITAERMSGERVDMPKGHHAGCAVT
jgi:hypothetical protein